MFFGTIREQDPLRQHVLADFSTVFHSGLGLVSISLLRRVALAIQSQDRTQLDLVTVPFIFGQHGILFKFIDSISAENRQYFHFHLFSEGAADRYVTLPRKKKGTNRWIT